MYYRKKYDKIFFKSKLAYNKIGYYHLNPMPNLKFLEKYYKNCYWQSRNDINYPVRKRDIEHYQKIVSSYKDFNSHPKKILNFGSGHGGISYLFYLTNHSIFNYDFGFDKVTPFKNRWANIKSLDTINFKFDLIYSSHSLEHVSDINKTLEQLKFYSNDKTIYFFEVPNGYKQNNIYPPHTYYFTRKFFFNSFPNADFCKTYLGSKEMKNEEGNIIRFHTRLN
jgi:predicted SAM-dependent methyltransferase